jgi:regulator of RNase E activity RraA
MPNQLDPVSQLLRYPTSVLSDALDELGVRGALSGIAARRIGQGRTAGRALTVRFERKSADPDAYRFGGGVGKPLERVLQTMADGDVIVMDLGGVDNAACWGGLASRLAQRRGVRGTIVWGACRDVEEIRAVGYPVWSAWTSPRRSRNDFTFGSINEPIEICGVRMQSKDFVLADETGAVVVPQSRIQDALRLAERIADQEAALEAQIVNNALSSWDAI